MSDSRKILTITRIPAHLQKLQELKAKIKKQEKAEIPIPLYKKEYVVKSFEWLYKTFPKCFFTRDQQPLKINILNDIFKYIENNQNDPSPSKRGLRSALSTYVRGRYYLKACKVGTSRIDLEGNQTSVITEEEALYAKDLYEKYTVELKERQKKQKKKTRHHHANIKPV